MDVVSKSQRKKGSIIEICSKSAIEANCQMLIINASEGCKLVLSNAFIVYFEHILTHCPVSIAKIEQVSVPWVLNRHLLI